MKTFFAVLFDWDGVVIDSSSQHERSWDLLSAETGRPLPPGHFKAGFGKTNATIIPSFGWTSEPAEILRLAQRKEEIYRSLVRSEGVTPLPGVVDLLRQLREEGRPRAVGSSTPRANIEAIMDVTGLTGMFDAVICGDDVRQGKPDPEIFQLGARALEVEPSRCVVIEDAFVGIEAARRAGMRVLAVATTHSLTELEGNADRAVASLAEITPTELADLFPHS